MEFYIVDVFAENKYGGNQLAVFTNAEGIGTDAMLNIAKEINFAESSFIINGDAENGFQVRIFTPESEIPFAGHPTVGTAYVIRKLLLKKKLTQLPIHLKIGKVMADFVEAENGELLTFITQVQPKFGAIFEKEEIAKLLNLEVEAIDDELPVSWVTTGLPYIIVPLKKLRSLKKIKTEAGSFLHFMKSKKLHKSNHPSGLTTSIFCFTPETYESENDYNSRMLYVEDEIFKEDAATGSANGCFLAYYLKYIKPEADISMEQGYEMRRPSQLLLKGSFSNDHFVLKVGGLTQLIARGEWFV